MENNIKGIDTSILAFEEEAVFNCNNEGLQAIQGVYSIKPDMLRNTREAADVPEESKVQFREVFEKEIHERREQYIEAIGAELKQTDRNFPCTSVKPFKEGLE